MRLAKHVHPVAVVVLKVTVLLFPILWLLVVSEPGARAVPSYSRQTGLSCATCHYAPPELRPFGRKFKLEGYTFTTKAAVSDDKKDHNSGLQLLEAFPISVLFDTSFTSNKSPQPSTHCWFGKSENRDGGAKVLPKCRQVPHASGFRSSWYERVGGLRSPDAPETRRLHAAHSFTVPLFATAKFAERYAVSNAGSLGF